MATLREQIAKLSSTLPEFKDPEDYFEDETTARLTEKDEEDISDLPSQKSKLRQRAAPLLTETDTKYAGKRTSRKKLEEVEQLASSLPDDYENDEDDDEDEDDKDEDDYDDDEDEDDKDEDDYDDDEDEDEEDDDDVGEDSLEEGDNSSTKVEMDYENERSEEDENLAEFQSNFKTVILNDSKPEFSFEDDGDFKKYAEDEDFNDEDDDDVSDDEGDVSSDNEEENQDEEIDEEEMKSFSKTSTKEEVLKGEAARQQLGLWDSFLEGRIKLQKVAGIINQIPQPNVWKEFEKNGREEFRQSAADTQKMLKKLLDKLVQLQTLLLLQNTETRSIVTGRKGGREEQKQNEDDEEIPSDTDEEEKPEQKQIPVIAGVKRKIRMEYYPEFLAKRHKEFQTFRNNTIQKWYDKTRLSGGKLKSKSFANFDQSTLHQIEQILGDKERLIKRTQLKRSVYTILGKPDEEMNTDQQSEHTETGIGGDSLKNYDAEIFDDSDFYHQQLREFIERKTADIDDPVAISRQWLEIQKLRNKVKKKIDTKASKGRKTRYNTHSKLVNFMAGVDNCSWTDESKDDLYKSLFGKRLNSAETVLNDSGVKLLQTSDES